ncbi:MAG: hypothetical protein HC834_02795 [Rhodospirillales bacterium]|nr:hypothetical protein [Rhodospirillales bacterium]
MVYGALVALFQRLGGGVLQGVPIADIGNAILYGVNIAAGVMITVIAHVALVIISWMMARAVGGPGGLIGIYRSTAYLLPIAIPTLPWLALNGAGSLQQAQAIPFAQVFGPLAFAGLSLVMIGLFQIFLVVQQVSPLRAAIGTVLTSVFITSILMIL